TVVALLTDGDPTTNPSPTLIADLGKAYLANWSAAIDAGVRDWAVFGLATTKGLFDAQTKRDLQNAEAANEGSDGGPSRADTEGDIGMVDAVIGALDDPNGDGSQSDSFINQHLLPMLGVPKLLADVKSVMGEVGELLDDLVIGPARVLLNPIQEAIADVKE